MKQELLENLIRLCVREVLDNPEVMSPAGYDSGEYAHKEWVARAREIAKDHGVDYDKLPPHKQEQINRILSKKLQKYNLREVGDETVGAAAPPAANQGSADQPPIPDDNEKMPEIPSSTALKGVVFVNPRDKSKLQKIKLNSADDASLKRELDKLASAMAGYTAKAATNIIPIVKDAIRNPNSTVYLYFGKYDPVSSEIFLMADKNLQAAKDLSVPPTELSSGTIPANFTQPTTPATNQVPPNVSGVNEEFKTIVKKIINEILYK
jgi:hypothetical protein